MAEMEDGVQERLSKRHQARQEEVQRRREERAGASLTEENRDYYVTEFNRQKMAVEALLAAQSLEHAQTQTAQLRKLLNDSLPHLSPYALRQNQAALLSLQAAVNDARGQARPRSKFTFKTRTRATDATDAKDTDPKDTDAKDTDPKDTDVHTDVTHTDVTQAHTGVTQTDVTDAAVKRIETEQCTFSNLKGVTLTKTAEEISQRDVLLCDLEDCSVRLQGAPSSLHLKKLRRCELRCGPVSSSVFVDHCDQSVLALACQQLRTHNTTDTQVYLHVTSRAIIEDCRGVSVAPFSWSYSGLDQDWIVSGLDPKTNNWNHVDDFNWLSSSCASPNWTVIPEEQRRSQWE